MSNYVRLGREVVCFHVFVCDIFHTAGPVKTRNNWVPRLEAERHSTLASGSVYRCMESCRTNALLQWQVLWPAALRFSFADDHWIILQIRCCTIQTLQCPCIELGYGTSIPALPNTAENAVETPVKCNRTPIVGGADSDADNMKRFWLGLPGVTMMVLTMKLDEVCWMKLPMIT